MFRQIVSNLSLSPAAAGQLSFYAKRLKQEKVTRTFSAIAAVLLIGLQFTVITAPPIASNAASPSDIIPGGFQTSKEFFTYYDSHKEVRDVYSYFGVSRKDIVDAKRVQINSRDTSLNSLGRVWHAKGDTKVVIDNETFWARYLHSFDTGSNVRTGSYYYVLQGKSASTGRYFAIMYRCGNIVFKSLPKPPVPPKPVPPKPAPATLACVKLNGSGNKGDTPYTVGFATVASASGQTVKAYNFNYGDGSKVTTASRASSHTYTKAGTFVATVTVTGSLGKTTAVSAPCSYTVTTTTPKVKPPTPTLACTSLTGSGATGDLPFDVSFATKATATNQTITQYHYDYGDGTKEDSDSATIGHTYTTGGKFIATVTVSGSAGATTAVTAPCSYTVTTSTTPGFTPLKSAFDITQNKDANGLATAGAGDQIKYTLSVTNTGSRPGTYTYTDNITDVLEYADVTDLGGGTIAKDDNDMSTISWPVDTIPGGGIITHTFTVTVKNPIPDTPVSTSDQFSYDLCMDNIFGGGTTTGDTPPPGTTTHTCLTPPPAKQIETASTTLPDTGAGTTTMVVIIFAAFVFYFYLRNRQLATEIRILRGDYHGGTSI